MLLLCHRQELVGQISNALAANTPHGIIAARYPETPGPLQPTLARRLDRTGAPDLSRTHP